MTTFLFLCFGFISSYLISLDVLLRYPVTPNVSSRSRRALQYVFGIHLCTHSTSLFTSSHRLSMKMTPFHEHVACGSICSAAHCLCIDIGVYVISCSSICYFYYR